MEEASDEQVLAVIVDFFVSSSDFNGILAVRLTKKISFEWEKTRKILERFLSQEDISVVFYSHQGNPHIKRLPDLPSEEQVKRLYIDSPDTFCIYPSHRILQQRTDLEDYSDKPFAKRLALGEAQLTPVYFDLAVLERYHRDPRYFFSFGGSGGRIAIGGDDYLSEDMPERDKILIETFGIGYNQARDRVVCVYLRYLILLSPEHQQIWLAHIVDQPCSINSDYARVTIDGDFPEYKSAYQALLSELTEINKICKLIGKPHLFREEFEDNRPSDFHPMLRPTKRNLQDFIHLLDKMISENIDRKFFDDDIPLEEEKERSDGKIEVQSIATISLLRNWLQSHYRTSNGQDVSEEVVKGFRKVRKLRQKPAHTIQEDEYDRTLPREQDALVEEVYLSLNMLRLALSSHPRARDNYKPPDWLNEGKIVFY